MNEKISKKRKRGGKNILCCGKSADDQGTPSHLVKANDIFASVHSLVTTE